MGRSDEVCATGILGCSKLAKIAAARKGRAGATKMDCLDRGVIVGDIECLDEGVAHGGIERVMDTGAA
jgi:hypothetical protein